MVLIANSKLNSIEVLIFTTVVDTNTSHDEFVFIKKCAKRTCVINKKM